ncbi:MAG: TauD/TfdA family dioxygenase [Cyanobacteria bacterium P01_F01_bin.143]
MITIQPLDNQRTLPLLVNLENSSKQHISLENLISWYQNNQEMMEDKLLKHGAILFRGFSIDTGSKLKSFVDRIFKSQFLKYTDGTSPRSKIEDGIYTSTEFPAEYPISLHNELSYSYQWPNRLFFCCVTPAVEGGETPIADSRSILKNIDPQIVAEFNTKKIKYIRKLNNGQGFGLSWQKAFETDDQAIVEDFCTRAKINYEWQKDGGLRISEIRPAIAIHPQTQEQVWFNQADQFHPSTLPPDLYESLLLVFQGREEELSSNCCFGDDSAIEVSKLDAIRETIKQETVTFSWQKGDLLVLDNMLACHGRMPFVGPRKILVSMI